MAGFLVFADEPAFCAADGGQVEYYSEVGGDAEAAGVGDSLAIYEEDVGEAGEFFDGGDAGGDLPETQQARNVGEFGFHRGVCDLYQFKIGYSEYHNSGDDGFAVF